jgi:hypothetical protein
LIGRHTIVFTGITDRLLLLNRKRYCNLDRKNGINFALMIEKPQLLVQIKTARAENLYSVDNIIKENGCVALHLPRNSTALNFIGLIRRYYKNTTA